jgi:hypothetical protein
VKALVPQINTYRDFRHLLEDTTIDEVLIATIQNQHRRQRLLSGDNHGVESRPFQAHAQGTRRVGTHSPGRYADEQLGGIQIFMCDSFIYISIY